MATPVILPRQGQSVESCIIGEWHKKAGDSVAIGDALFSYETDKASFEEEAKADGTLLAVFFDAQDDVPVLTCVAVIGAPGEDIAGFDPRGGAPAAAETAATPEAAPAPAAETAAAAAKPPVSAAAETGGAASPRARGTANRLNIDLTAAAGSGPNGRVIERDVLALRAAAPMAQAAPAAASAQPAAGVAADYTDVKLSNIRKIIAQNMHQSLISTAQLTHNSSFDASNILAYRAQLKKAAEKQPDLPNITLNDIVLYAVSRVLPKHPDLNAHFLDDKIRRFTHVHLGVAVDTPRGLMVPTLFDADQKSLAQISAEAKQLAAAAIDGSISPDLLSGASFTISNLGALGIESFTPVINPPQTGILGVCKAVERVRTAGGQLAAYPAMGLSLTYDHRAVDGAPASRFLKDLGEALERFTVLLAGV